MAWSFFRNRGGPPEAVPIPEPRSLDLTRKLIASVLGRSGNNILGSAPLGDGDGIDFVVQTSNGETLAILAVDIDSAGDVQLSTHPVFGMQLSGTWLNAVVDNLPDDSPIRETLESAISQGSLRTIVSGVDKATKSLILRAVSVA